MKQLLKAKASIYQIKRGFSQEGERSSEIRRFQKELRSESRHHAFALRKLKTGQRSKFIRLKVTLNNLNFINDININTKGIPEDKHSIENTVEKVSELLEYLGFQIEESDIERANRVGGGRDDDGKGPRAIGNTTTTLHTFILFIQ